MFEKFLFLSLSKGRKRNWFAVDEAVQILSVHKPIQSRYLKTTVIFDYVTDQVT